MSIKDLISKFAPAIVLGAGKLADSIVKGESLNKDQKQGLFMAYVVIKVGGDDVAESLDSAAFTLTIDELADFCADTLEEAGIDVPYIPEELLEA